MNDVQIINLVVKGLISDGWKIYGDDFIGFRAFKEAGGIVKEFDFNKIYRYEGPDSDECCEALNSICKKVKTGYESECPYEPVVNY